MFRNPFSKSYMVQCPDGPRTVFKNVDDVFPLHLKYAKNAATASVKGLEQLQGRVDLKAEERVSTVLIKLDELNQSMQAQFRAAYTVFQASPCTELPYFRAAVEKIIVDEQRLRSIQTIIDYLNNIIIKRPKGAPLDTEVMSVTNAQLGQAISNLAPQNQIDLSQKMSDVPRLTEEWKGK